MTVKIYLGSGVWLLSEPRQWILARKKRRKDREWAYDGFAFFQHLDQALCRALETRLKESAAQSIGDLLNAHENALAELRTAIKEGDLQK